MNCSSAGLKLNPKSSIPLRIADEIFSVGETFFNINTNYEGQSSDVNFLIDEDIIYSKNLSNFR